jgi:hypothetical protein
MNRETKKKIRHPDSIGATAAHREHRRGRLAMKTLTRTFATGLAMTLAIFRAAFAQEMPAQQEHTQHHHGDIALVRAEYPRMGRAQEHAQSTLVTLEQAQKMAGETNPTLRQADA